MLVRVGELESSGRMRVRVLNNGRTLSIFTEENGFLGPDRRTKFADVEFTVQAGNEGTFLVGSGRFERYREL